MLVAWFLVFSVAAVAGQTRTYVSPSWHNQPRFISAVDFPVDHNTPTTYTHQQIHGDLPLHPLRIYCLAFRPAPQGVYQASTATLTIRLSTSAATRASTMSTFAANHGKDMTEVATAVRYKLPAVNTTGTGPWPFSIRFPFTRSYTYLGSRLGRLVWEIRVHAVGGGGDLKVDQTMATVTNGVPFGAGGVPAGKSRPAICSGHGLGSCSPKTGTFSLFLGGNNLPENAPYLILLGHNDRSWGPFPLPLDLGILGGKGNTLYLEPLLATGAHDRSPRLGLAMLRSKAIMAAVAGNSPVPGFGTFHRGRHPAKPFAPRRHP